MLGPCSYAYDDPYVTGLTLFLCFAFCFALMLMLSCESGLSMDFAKRLLWKYRKINKLFTKQSWSNNRKWSLIIQFSVSVLFDEDVIIIFLLEWIFNK